MVKHRSWLEGWMYRDRVVEWVKDGHLVSRLVRDMLSLVMMIGLESIKQKPHRMLAPTISIYLTL